LKNLNQNQIKPQSLKRINSQTSIHSNSSSLSSKGSALILLCGGNREIPEVLRQIEIITKSYSQVIIVMTHAAIKILGIPEIRKASDGATIVTEYSEEYFEKEAFRIMSGANSTRGTALGQAIPGLLQAGWRFDRREDLQKCLSTWPRPNSRFAAPYS
jgi:hypothetical protein